VVGADDLASLLLPDVNSKRTAASGAAKTPAVNPAADSAKKTAAPQPQPGAQVGEAAEPPAPPAAARSFVDPNTVAALDAVDAGHDAEDVDEAVHDDVSLDADTVAATPPRDAAKAQPAVPEKQEPAAAEADPTLGLESPAARLSKPAMPDFDFPGIEPAADAPDTGEHDGEAVPEYHLSESSFADLSADFEEGDEPGLPQVEADDEFARPVDAASHADGLHAAPAPGGNGSNGHGGVAHPAAASDQTAVSADDASATAPPKGTSWVDALRRTPLWIPSESAPPSATPEGWGTGANMELESVIDSFREQMARALDGDGAARYDLGVAYYEMGLYNEALAEFEAASRCPGLACLLQTDRHTEVVELLLPVLAADGHSPRGRLGLQYSLGLAYEALGDREQARRCFEEVALVDIDFKDVQVRLQGIA
jgi:hypothetical protein